MYCKKCGKELVEGVSFCSECGEPVIENKSFDDLASETEEVLEAEVVDACIVDETEPKKHVPRCFTVFGNVGYTLSLVGFICSFIPIINYMTIQASLIGLIFCILGKRDLQLADKTKKGRIFGILGLVFGFVIMIVATVVLELISYYA